MAAEVWTDKSLTSEPILEAFWSLGRTLEIADVNGRTLATFKLEDLQGGAQASTEAEAKGVPAKFRLKGANGKLLQSGPTAGRLVFDRDEFVVGGEVLLTLKVDVPRKKAAR